MSYDEINELAEAGLINEEEAIRMRFEAAKAESTKQTTIKLSGASTMTHDNSIDKIIQDKVQRALEERIERTIEEALSCSDMFRALESYASDCIYDQIDEAVEEAIRQALNSLEL